MNRMSAKALVMTPEIEASLARAALARSLPLFGILVLIGCIAIG